MSSLDPDTLRACALELEQLADDAVSGPAPSDRAVGVARFYRAIGTRWRARAARLDKAHARAERAEGCPVCERVYEWCTCDSFEEP